MKRNKKMENFPKKFAILLKKASKLLCISFPIRVVEKMKHQSKKVKCINIFTKTLERIRIPFE